MEDSELLWGDDRVEDNAEELAVIQMLAYKLEIYNPITDKVLRNVSLEILLRIGISEKLYYSLWESYLLLQ